MRRESAGISLATVLTADVRVRAHDKLTWSSLLSVIITDFRIPKRYAELIYPVSSLIPAHLPPPVVLFLPPPPGLLLVRTPKLNPAFARFGAKLGRAALSILDPPCGPHSSPQQLHRSSSKYPAASDHAGHRSPRSDSLYQRCDRCAHPEGWNAVFLEGRTDGEAGFSPLAGLANVDVGRAVVVVCFYLICVDGSSGAEILALDFAFAGVG